MLRGISVAFVLGLGLPCSARTIIVDLNGTPGIDDVEFTEIQPALDAAADGDEVVVKPGEYVIDEPIDFNRLHDPENPASPPAENIVLRSEAGAEKTIIRMAKPARDSVRESVVIFENGESSESVLEGFTLTGGNGTDLLPGCPSAECNSAGGGISILDGSSPLIRACTILENRAEHGGGVYCALSSARFEGCRLVGNSAGEEGGAVSFESCPAPSLDGCVLEHNEAEQAGALHCLSSGLRMSDCVLSENSTERNPGSVNLALEPAAEIVRCRIERNFGGGIYCRRSSPRIADCEIVANLGDSGISIDGWTAAPSILGCEIRGNSSIHSCDPDGCRGGGGGGILVSDMAQPLISGCRIIGNAAFRGGGIFCRDECSPSFVNCVVAGNLALEEGGVLWTSSSTVTLISCTVANNTTTEGPPLACAWEPAPTLRNCIVWEDGAPPGQAVLDHCMVDRDPQFMDGGAFDFLSREEVPHDGEIHVRPSFILRAPDYSLAADSPAIDAGTVDGAPVADIEGNGRPCGGGIDIGAYEHGDCPGPGSYIRGDADGDGTLLLTDAVFTLLHLFAGGAAPTCLAAADSTADGILDLSDAVYSLSFLFLGGPTIPPPYPECGRDLDPFALPCPSHGACP